MPEYLSAICGQPYDQFLILALIKKAPFYQHIQNQINDIYATKVPGIDPRIALPNLPPSKQIRKQELDQWLQQRHLRRQRIAANN
jgi:hypothetical protein